MPITATDLNLEEQIGQVLMVGFQGITPSPEIIDLIQHHHVGNIILFSRNIGSTQQVLTLTQDLQRIAKEAGHPYPLLIAIDQENGMVQRLGEDATTFPGNMAQGAIGSEQLTYEIALATAQELKALGINMNLAPVVDVNNNPANPVIGVRSFGEDPQQVAHLASATVRGYHSGGIISCLKHFPGHGDTAIDSHLALPTVAHSMQRLEELELVPFKRGIEDGTDTVMIAHMVFSALEQERNLPATLSPFIVQELLRQHLGFKGVVISDCLEMNAIAKTFGIPKGTVMALQAGNDLILISHQYPRQKAGIEAIQQAIQTGTVSRARLVEATERVLKLKQQYLSWDTLSTGAVSVEVGGKVHQQLRDHAYELSTTLVRDNVGLIPLHPKADEQLLLLYPVKEAWSMVQDRQYPYEFLIESIRKQHHQLTALPVTPTMTSKDYEQIYRTAREASIIVVVTINAYTDRQQTELMHELLKLDRPVIGIALYNPYDLLAFPELQTYLVTYENTKPALNAVLDVLFGRRQPLGHLPVSLPGIYPLEID